MSRNTDFIPFARPSLSEEEEEAVIRVLRSGWISTGRETERFERKFAEYMGVKYALGVNSATAGLHLSLIAAGVKRDTRVLMSPFTFTATAEICRYMDAHPRFVDIDSETLNVDPEEMERELGKGGPYSAAIPVHIAGYPCDMERIRELSREYELPIIEDAAHAFPVRTAAGWLGTLGTAGVFSFYATKPITTGEGGMIVTDNDEFARTLATYRLHGIDRIVWDRYQTKKSSGWEYDILAPGYKYNLNDIASAIGLIQLGKAEDLRKRRAEIAETYFRELGGLDFLTLPASFPGHSWHLFILRIVSDKLNISRDEFIERLYERGIGMSVHFKPLHLMSYYRKTYDLRPSDFPKAMEAYERCMSLPIYPGLSDEQVHYICEAVREIGKKGYRK